MGITVFPTVSGGGIKTVQRGQAVSSGSITITAIDTNKAYIMSYSEGSAGSVAASGNETGTLSPGGGSTRTNQTSGQNTGAGSFPSYSGTRSFTGGTTSLTSALYGAYISNSTTIIATGACRWEVVEFA